MSAFDSWDRQLQSDAVSVEDDSQEEFPRSAPTPLAPAKVACEDAIARVLTSSMPTESIAMAFARRERELLELFATLTPEESRTLHWRLTHPSQHDPIAAGVSRMILERRQRLVAFLADARRRAASFEAKRRR